jgi:hypothetical protein
MRRSRGRNNKSKPLENLDDKKRQKLLQRLKKFKEGDKDFSEDLKGIKDTLSSVDERIQEINSKIQRLETEIEEKRQELIESDSIYTEEFFEAYKNGDFDIIDKLDFPEDEDAQKLKENMKEKGLLMRPGTVTAKEDEIRELKQERDSLIEYQSLLNQVVVNKAAKLTEESEYSEEVVEHLLDLVDENRERQLRDMLRDLH